MTGRETLPSLHEVKDALKDLLENAGLTRSQRRKIGDLLGCETEFGFRSLAAKYNIGISYDEDNVYVTFYGKNEEFEKPKALIGKKTPWRRFSRNHHNRRRKDSQDHVPLTTSSHNSKRWIYRR